MPRYDAVVVGAGPAGSATAAHLARSGARVLLCDKSAFPRDKACGGGLTPRGVAALERLKIDLGPSDAVAVGGLEMVGNGKSLTVDFPRTAQWPSYGLVARRSVLDQKVLDAAVDAGAELRECRVAGPLFEDGSCRGVRVKVNGSTEDVQAEWTIAADGATSSIARAAGLAPGSTSSGDGFWYAAMRAYFAPVSTDGARPSDVLRRYEAAVRSGYGFQFATSFRIMKAMRRPVLAAAAAAVGFRSRRALRAGVRVMAYLIEDDPQTRSTVSRWYRRAARGGRPAPRGACSPPP